MRRRDLLKGTMAAGVWAALPWKPFAADTDSIPVAFVVSDRAVVIDFAGPWEVFQDVTVPGRTTPAFTPYTVAEHPDPIRATGGMRIVPDYTFATAPAPKIVVIPAQRGVTEPLLNWIRTTAKTTDLTMSVCVGANVLAQTGLLSGKAATTHHDSYQMMTLQFPDVQVKRGVRFVVDGNVASSGGLSSGIDLALHVVERYYGREVAQRTAFYMEYQGQGWLDPSNNGIYNTARVSTPDRPLCPVCGMEVDPKTDQHVDYAGKTYVFCTIAHKTQFEMSPEKFAK